MTCHEDRPLAIQSGRRALTKQGTHEVVFQPELKPVRRSYCISPRQKRPATNDRLRTCNGNTNLCVGRSSVPLPSLRLPPCPPAIFSCTHPQDPTGRLSRNRGQATVRARTHARSPYGTVRAGTVLYLFWDEGALRHLGAIDYFTARPFGPVMGMHAPIVP